MLSKEKKTRLTSQQKQCKSKMTKCHFKVELNFQTKTEFPSGYGTGRRKTEVRYNSEI